MTKTSYKGVLIILIVFNVLLLGYIIVDKVYQFNQYHFFDPFYQTPINRMDVLGKKSENEVRVLVLGGSTTANRSIADSLRFTYLLEGKLSDYFKQKKITVINGGMDWYSVKHSALTYIAEYRSMDPDIVMVMHGINDLYRSFNSSAFSLGEVRADYSHFYGASINGANPPSLERFVYEKYCKNSVESKWATFSPKQYAINSFVAVHSFEKYYRNLAQIVKAENKTLVLLTQPSLYKDSMTLDEKQVLWFGKTFCYQRTGFLKYEYPDHSSMRLALDSFNRIVQLIASEEQAILIDLDKKLPKDKIIFTDDVHFTVDGNRKIAQLLFQHITEDSLIRR